MRNDKNYIVNAFISSPSVFMVITISISLIGIGLCQVQIGIAQQQQPQVNLSSTEQQRLLDGISFQIDNVTFSHHMAM
jgi:hypothetical protein